MALTFRAAVRMKMALSPEMVPMVAQFLFYLDLLNLFSIKSFFFSVKECLVFWYPQFPLLFFFFRSLFIIIHWDSVIFFSFQFILLLQKFRWSLLCYGFKDFLFSLFKVYSALWFSLVRLFFFVNKVFVYIYINIWKYYSVNFVTSCELQQN